MKKTILKQERRGFTVAELLAVLLILVILIGLGVPGFIALRKNIKIAEYDDIAREIYLAAQNQLTRLSANGMDKETVDLLSADERKLPYMSEPSDYDETSGGPWNQDDYRYTRQGTECTELLLPLGAVADSVRTNGIYIIEYNAVTNTVYGVFYSEKAFGYYEDVDDAEFRLSRDVRKKVMVGYYGGSAVRQNPQNYCEMPQLQIINNNELKLVIQKGLEYMDPDWITVSVSDGEHTEVVPKERIAQVVEEQTHTVLLDSMVEGARFKDFFMTLTPGKDLNITVTFHKPGTLPSSASISANSLFATRETAEPDKDVVTIAWARHLQNLEHSVSNLNDPLIAIARQTDHIQWEKDFGNFTSIRNQDETAEYNENLLRYEGSNLEIREFTGENGLFALTKEKMALSGIRLVNPDIHAPSGTTEPVGALVGTAQKDTQIASCGVYYSKTNADGTVDYNAYKNRGIVNASATVTGGLIGTATDVTVNNSFAALPRITGTGASLIGNAAGCKITNSYANCDDLPTSNFRYFIGGAAGNTVVNCYAVGNVENDKTGIFADDINTVSGSYYAVSHRRFAADPKDNRNLALTEFYYKVGEEDNWAATDQNGMVNATDVDGWAAGWANLSAPLTHPYRMYLDGRGYPYPAIGALDHYGSWPDDDGTVDLKITMQLLNNENAGYAVFAGRVIVTTDKDGKEETLFDSDRHRDENGKFDGEDTVKVAPGTNVKITVTDAEGYRYTYTRIASLTTYENELAYSVEKDTEVFVYFQQNTFKLTCAAPINQQGDVIKDGTYLAVLGDSRVIKAPGFDDKVETGTTVTVQLKLPQGMQAGVIWYTIDNDPNSERHILVPNAQKNYAFSMPSANTTLHVQYTDQVATFHVEYYVMNPEDGKYPTEPTSKNDINYAIGTVITRNVIQTLAENSGRLLTIGDVDVLYLDGETLTKWDDPTPLPLPYDTKDDADKTEFTLKIRIARKKSTVTLEAGDNIEKVSFKGLAQPGDDPKTVSQTFWYGKKLTAVATVAPGQDFTTWEPDTGLFRASSSVENDIEVPYFDVTLTAKAIAGFYQVTLNLMENEESWLAGSESRQADPIRVTLESTKDPDEIYEMRIPDPEADDISYITDTVVRSIPDLGEGYRIKVTYTRSGVSEYVKNMDGTDRIVKVRERAVEENVNFFTVTYYPSLEIYRGSVPQGGTYLQFYQLKVPGNVGHLRNDETNNKIFAGWFDAGVEGVDRTPVGVGETYTVTRRTDFFVNWVENLRVTYDANDNVGADDPDQTFAATGELPVDSKGYNDGDTVTVKAGSLARNGYTFLGWSKDPDAEAATYSPGDTFTIEAGNVSLFAIWRWDAYTLRFLNLDGTEHASISDKHYGDVIGDPPVCEGPNGEAFLGWATDPGGDVVFRNGEPIKVTGSQTLYPRFEMRTVDITYHYGENHGTSQTVKAGEGIPFYLNCDAAGVVTAWRTEDSKSFYLCEEGTARSLEPAAFTENIDLYAVYGKVYNFNQQIWHDTLKDAVEKASADDTLIVYRNTQETGRIEFSTDVNVLSNGNRTVTWEGATDAKLSEENEFVGCMYVYGTADAPCTVQFGKSNIAALSMNGTLTFNAAKKSRVMALGTGARFYMYDGITFTNGYRKPTDNPTNWTSNEIRGDGNGFRRSYFGGGVYAGLDSEFYMRGGTISYCSAYRGGGVYLYGDREQNKGCKMYMGEMVKPTTYSATAIYYDPDGKYYISQTGVTVENYRDYYVANGNPEICYNTATQVKIACTENSDTGFSYADGGGGLLMLDLPDGSLELYRGSIHNNEAYANGGGIVTDGGGKVNGNDVGNDAELRIYEVDISHNRAGGFGGGIFQWQGIIHIYNSTMRQNYSDECGGGIYLHHYRDENSDVNFYFGDIADNEARRDGGGVYVEKGLDVLISGGNLRNNIAGQGGGGVYLAGLNGTKYSELILSSGAIYDNKGNHNDKNHPEKGNDVYLNGGSYMTAMKGGLNLSQNNPGQKNAQIMVDGYNGGALREYALIVNYNKSTDFKAEDADLFRYWPNDWDTNKLQVMPSENTEDHTLEAPLILRDPDNMKKRTLEFYKNDGSLDADGNPVKVEAQAEVGQTFTAFPSAESVPPFVRDGYYIAGWARTPDAYEEDFIAYYNSLDGKWYMTYELANGVAQWTNPGDVPTYQVDERYDQKFYAIWKPYVVRYNLGSANSTIPPMDDGIGPKVRIVGPAKDTFDWNGVTYSFRGWSTTENATASDPNYAAGQEIQLTNSNLTLYAVWRPSVVRITFNFNGGSDKEGRFQIVETVTRGQPLAIPDYNITLTDKGFDGWSLVMNGPLVYQTGDQITTADETEDLTLYAVWRDIYTVRFHLTGGTVNGNPADRVQSVIQGEPVPLNEEPIQPGFVFMGWAETEGGAVIHSPETPSMTPTSNLDLYAVWRRCNVTFDLNDPSTFWPGGGQTRMVEADENGVVSAPTDVPPNASGLILIGWAKDKTAGEPEYDREITPETDMILYAVWGVKVTFNYNYEDAPESEVFKVSDWNIPSFTIPVANPGRDSYDFMGWKHNQNPSDPLWFHNQTPNLSRSAYDNIFTACWAKPVPVTLMLNDGTDDEFRSDTGHIGSEFPYELPTKEKSPERDGFVFDGWVEDPFDLGSIFQPGQKIEIPEGATELTLYAVWESIDTLDSSGVAYPEQEAFTLDPDGVPLEPQTWEVTFYPDGGELMENAKKDGKPLEDPLFDGEEEFFTYTVPVGEDVTLLAPVLEREGYVLDGWMRMDEEEPDPYRWDFYPADEELPITGDSVWIPVWTVEEQPTVETVEEEDPIPAEDPLETEIPAEQAAEPPKIQEPEPSAEQDPEPVPDPEAEPEPEAPTIP